MLRAKFRIMSVTHHHNGSVEIRALPVRRSDDDENFWRYTPSGELTFQLSNDAPAKCHFVGDGELQAGTVFYLDLSPESAS